MPKLPRIKGSKCVSTLERMGFEIKRQLGSHVIMRRGDRGCVVPLHQELKTGTLHGLLKQAGIDPDDFIQMLNS